MSSLKTSVAGDNIRVASNIKTSTDTTHSAVKKPKQQMDQSREISTFITKQLNSIMTSAGRNLDKTV